MNNRKQKELASLFFKKLGHLEDHILNGCNYTSVVLRGGTWVEDNELGLVPIDCPKLVTDTKVQIYTDHTHIPLNNFPVPLFMEITLWSN